MVVAAWLRKWWVLLVAALAVGWAILRHILARPEQEDELARALDGARRRAEDKVAEANARAAIAISIARTHDAQAKAQLQAILEDPDEARRLTALIAMQQRLRTP